MSVSEAEIVFHIHYLKTLQREIPIEPDPQLATMMKVLLLTIPDLIEKFEDHLKLIRTGALEHGKKVS